MLKPVQPAFSPLWKRGRRPHSGRGGFARRPDIRRRANPPAALRASAPFDEGGEGEGAASSHAFTRRRKRSRCSRRFRIGNINHCGAAAFSPLWKRGRRPHRGRGGFARRPDIRRRANPPAALRASAPFDEGGESGSSAHCACFMDVGGSSGRTSSRIAGEKRLFALLLAPFAKGGDQRKSRGASFQPLFVGSSSGQEDGGSREGERHARTCGDLQPSEPQPQPQPPNAARIRACSSFSACGMRGPYSSR
jgi:hypothetical protein